MSIAFLVPVLMQMHICSMYLIMLSEKQGGDNNDTLTSYPNCNVLVCKGNSAVLKDVFFFSIVKHTGSKPQVSQALYVTLTYAFALVLRVATK